MVQHFLDQDQVGGNDQSETIVSDLVWPFGQIDGLDEDDLSMAAYEIFFTACRSSPGFGGRNGNNLYPSDGGMDGGGGSPAKGKGVGMAVTSKIKMALGLKMMRKRSLTSMTLDRDPSSPRECSSPSAGGSPRIGFKPTKRPLTSAEIMRQQMKVTEHSDNRLRKTLMRTLVGQMGRRAETIILPLELLRHLKLSEFNSSAEYHEWQRRQLKLLEEGLLLHPSLPIENFNEFAIRLQDIINSSEAKPIDTNKNSESMKTLCNCVSTLAWRSTDTESHTGACHWADGYPLNVHIYIALLRAIFDIRDETMVLDVVDELVELIKKTWSTLGINRSMHNLCFTWVLFEQYVTTGEVEVDLLGASLAMLSEVASDAKRVDNESVYAEMLRATLFSMKNWLEKRLMDYHAYFDDMKLGSLGIFLGLVFSATKILEEDVPGYAAAAQEDSDIASDLTGNPADLYIRSSLKNAFARMLEDGDINGHMIGEPNASEALLQVAKQTQDLAMKERKIISPILRKWNPFAAGVAAVTLHNCYGTLLKEYLTGSSLLLLSNEAMEILHRAGKLEKLLVQIAVEEDSAECEDGGNTMAKEMVTYGVDSVITRSMRLWIQERLKRMNDLVESSKESETWNPKSKNEPYGYSAIELMKHATQATEEFLEIPVGIAEDLAHTFAHGLEDLFDDYISFISSCGSKRSYVPALPPLTRCNKDSKIMKLWKKAAPSAVNQQNSAYNENNEGNNNPKLSTSRGTQRLYIRLNSLQYILSQLQVLSKTLSASSKIIASPHNRLSHQLYGRNYFEQTRSAIQSATQHISQVAAYRLIFLDSNSVFYGGLYIHNVEDARIRPALRILKQNMSLLTAMVIDPVQPLAVKEVMKAAFEAFLMVLLAGGSSRVFKLTDHKMLEDDFDHLKKVFTLGEGLVPDEVVEKESQTVEGVLELMGESTTKLVHDFTTVACQSSGVGSIAAGQKLPMPPTTGNWQREDANTILRVLCHRNDAAANHFLKSRFQLPRRR